MTKTFEQPVRRYRQAMQNLDGRRAELYDAVREAHAEGMSLRALAAETGLSFGRIHQIVKHR